VGPRADLDTEARENSFRLCRESNLDRPVVQSVARHYADSATRLTCTEALWTLYSSYSAPPVFDVIIFKGVTGRRPGT
jgi:hypothetical protein